jgi:hypothetical protein
MRAKSVMYIDYIYRGAIEEKQLDRQVYILTQYEKIMSEYKTTPKASCEKEEAIHVVASIIHKKMDSEWLNDWLEEVIDRGLWNPEEVE